MLVGCSCFCLGTPVSLVPEAEPPQADAQCQHSDNSSSVQEPWAEQQEPLSLFIWFWHVTENRSDPAPALGAPWLAGFGCDGPRQEVPGKLPVSPELREILSCC